MAEGPLDRAQRDEVMEAGDHSSVLYKYPIDQKEVDIQAVSKNKVQILAKCNNPHLHRIDHCMKIELLDKF